MKLDSFPRGKRLRVSISGRDAILLWFRGSIYALEERSPAEGAYSEGFTSEDSRLTEDGCITCPTTGSKFRLETGELVEHLPGNPVLRFLTPAPRNAETFPVKTEEDMVYVYSRGSLGTPPPSLNTKGGVGTSAEEANVFAIQPKVYVEGGGEEEQQPDVALPSDKSMPASKLASIAVGTLAVAFIASAGTALCLLYFQSIVALGAFWGVGFLLAAIFAVQYFKLLD